MINLQKSHETSTRTKKRFKLVLGVAYRKSPEIQIHKRFHHHFFADPDRPNIALDYQYWREGKYSAQTIKYEEEAVEGLVDQYGDKLSTSYSKRFSLKDLVTHFAIAKKRGIGLIVIDNLSFGNNN